MGRHRLPDMGALGESPLKRCPFAPKGQRGAHDLTVVLPDNDANPMLMACTRCGDIVRHDIQVVQAMAADDLPSDAIEKLARRTHG